MKWKRLLFDKFSHLLIVLIVFFILSPFISHFIMPFLLLIAIILTLRTLGLKKKILNPLIILACTSIVIYFFLEFFTSEKLARPTLIVTLIYFSLFLCFSIVLLMKKMFMANHITFDTIVGTICVYLLMGFLGSGVYAIIYLADYNAFSLPSEGTNNFFYFSFTTLTTLGYGDITPINAFAKMLTSLQSVIGQLYLAVFIARFVGIYIAQEMNKK